MVNDQMTIRIVELTRLSVRSLVDSAFSDKGDEYRSSLTENLLDVEALDLVRLYQESMQKVDLSFVTYIVRDDSNE